MKRARMILAMVLLAGLLTGFVGAQAATLTLTNSVLTMLKGEKTTLKIAGVQASKVTWKSSNKAVAAVSKKGVVTAKKAGKATITGKVGKITFRCKVTVVQVRRPNLTLYSGEFGKLTLKEVNGKGFLLKYTNTTKHDIWLMAQYFVLDGKQLEPWCSDEADEHDYLIHYNDFDVIVPEGWSKEAQMYLEEPAFGAKKFSGYLDVIKYETEHSGGDSIGSMLFKNVKLK